MLKYLDLEKYLDDVGVTFEEILNATPHGSNCDVYLTGSLACGHGTPSSDVDMHIVYKQDFEPIIGNVGTHVYNFGNLKAAVYEVNGVSIDSELVQLDDIVNAIEVVDSINLGGLDTDVISSISKKYDNTQLASIFHRIFTGRKIFSGIRNDYLSRMSGDNWFRWRALRDLKFADSLLEDSIGFAQVEDTLGFRQSVYLLFRQINSAILSANHISFDREKWIPYLFESHGLLKNEEYALCLDYMLLMKSVSDYDKVLDCAEDIINKYSSINGGFNDQKK